MLDMETWFDRPCPSTGKGSRMYSHSVPIIRACLNSPPSTTGVSGSIFLCPSLSGPHVNVNSHSKIEQNIVDCRMQVDLKWGMIFAVQLVLDLRVQMRASRCRQIWNELITEDSQPVEIGCPQNCKAGEDESPLLYTDAWTCLDPSGLKITIWKRLHLKFQD